MLALSTRSLTLSRYFPEMGGKSVSKSSKRDDDDEDTYQNLEDLVGQSLRFVHRSSLKAVVTLCSAWRNRVQT